MLVLPSYRNQSIDLTFTYLEKFLISQRHTGLTKRPQLLKHFSAGWASEKKQLQKMWMGRKDQDYDKISYCSQKTTHMIKIDIISNNHSFSIVRILLLFWLLSSRCFVYLLQLKFWYIIMVCLLCSTTNNFFEG